jgi:hypothetical protein
MTSLAPDTRPPISDRTFFIFGGHLLREYFL